MPDQGDTLSLLPQVQNKNLGWPKKTKPSVNKKKTKKKKLHQTERPITTSITQKQQLKKKKKKSTHSREQNAKCRKSNTPNFRGINANADKLLYNFELLNSGRYLSLNSEFQINNSLLTAQCSLLTTRTSLLLL